MISPLSDRLNGSISITDHLIIEVSTENSNFGQLFATLEKVDNILDDVSLAAAAVVVCL